MPAQSERATSDGEISKASEAAREHPTAASWSRLGDAFMQKARETMDLSYYGRAEDAYRKALAIKPDYANAEVGVARVLSGRARIRAKYRVGQQGSEDGTKPEDRRLLATGRCGHRNG